MIDMPDFEEVALIDAIPNMQPGEIVHLHDTECPTWSGEGCACEPLLIVGPSGKA